MMSPYTFTPLFALLLILLGCARTPGSGEAGPGSVARTEPVLQADDDAKTILSKAVKAHGGEKAFARWSCGYVKYKTKGGIVPDLFGEVTAEDTFQLPAHFKRVVRTEAEVNDKPLVMVFVVNRGKGWIKRGDAPAEPMANDFTEKTEHPFANFCKLPHSPEGEARLTKLGSKNVDGKAAIGIRVGSDKFGEVDLYFDTQTGLLIKSRKLLPGSDPGTSGIVETLLDNYKDVQGTPVPMRITGAQDGKAILDVTLLDVKFADKFDESTFAKP